MTDNSALAARFEGSRPRLRAIAQRLLQSSADADDAVQETWLRLARVDVDQIENLEAWLTTVVSRVSLDILRAPRRTRERSWQVAAWRDEPAALNADPAETVAQADRVNLALMVVLDTLAPAERIAFVLHDVFGRPFDEIAVVVDRTPVAARQLASRARRRLRNSASTARPAPAQRTIVQAWLAAAQDGDLNALLLLLDENAVLHADYGASVQTIVGAADIAQQAVLSARLAAHSTALVVDGMPGVAAVFDGRIVSIMVFEIRAGRISALDVLADPLRLRQVSLPG